jgi:4'-phosphopantetheinyl transferase
MILVYYTFFSQPLSNVSFEKLLVKIPSVIREKVLRFSMWEDKHASLFGKLMLKKGLVDLGYTDELNFEYSEYDRPRLISNNDIDFNISHTKKAVVCIVSNDRRVGVDIEEIIDLDVTDFKNQWTEEEWHNIVGSSDSLHQFFTYWTRKEAVVKSDGRGLSISLKEIDVRHPIVKVDDNKWYLYLLNLVDDHLTHICSDKPFGEVEIKVEEVDFFSCD